MKTNRHFGTLGSVLILAALLLTAMPGGPVFGDQWRWSGVDRIVAVSDVHGAFGAMTKTLANAGVLDAELHWRGGTTHLVITGDILDRGPDSRKVMDLIMRLEEEAPESGGRVHLLLGNHEVMNLVGDLRYVSKEEYAAFAEDEPAELRERWFQSYRALKPVDADETSLRQEYAERYPLGFFGLRQAFGTEGAYGPWLMSKPLIVVINGTAFVHGGISPLVAELGLDGINRELKSQVTDYVTHAELLADAGILDPTTNFYRHWDLLKELPDDVERPAQIQDAIESVMQLNDASIHSQMSPLWYRGTVGCGPLIEEDKLAAGLAALEADRVVIGHTPTLTHRVLERMDGRVIEIDTGMLNAAYMGTGNALVIEGSALTVVGEQDPAAYAPEAHPRRVGFRAESLTADQLETILENGEITPTSTPESGKTIVEVTHFGQSISAVFTANARDKNVSPDLAAYRLDLMLGLDMVPVTVGRELGGKNGSLQFIPNNMQNDLERVAGRRGGEAWCPLVQQYETMYVFDSLIYNQGRRQENMLYSVDNWQLVLTEHKNSFSTDRGLPTYVANMEAQTGDKLTLSGGWKKALAALGDDVLTDQLGDVLNDRRIKALGRRRDDLLTR